MYCTVLCLALLASSNNFATCAGQQQNCTLGQKCCPDDEGLDLCYPCTTCTCPVPGNRSSEYPVKYLLYNRTNQTCPVVFTTENFTNINESYDPSKPTVIVFHGYNQSAEVCYLRNLILQYLKKVDANAISVDYSNISLQSNYSQVILDIRNASKNVTEAVNTLIGFGTPRSEIHLIGFSLGAHFAAYVAKATIPRIGRLTGLDPAGPGFTGKSCDERFCKCDAVFTEAIHSNGHPIIGLGTSDEDADVDFWVNGGWDQPNCGLTIDPWIFEKDTNNPAFGKYIKDCPCSHVRSVLLYTEALASNCTIWGVKPQGLDLSESRLFFGYPTKFTVHTQGCTLDSCVPIGLQTKNAKGRGSFIVPTNYDSPFCVSNMNPEESQSILQRFLSAQRTLHCTGISALE